MIIVSSSSMDTKFNYHHTSQVSIAHCPENVLKDRYIDFFP